MDGRDDKGLFVKGNKIGVGNGRDPWFESPEQMQVLIDKYFEDCKGVIAKDEEGNPIRSKYGYIYEKEPEPLTITGLALAIGFKSRQALINYEAKDGFNDAIARAKSRVEQYAEKRLYDRDGSQGAKFSLSNNFVGWTERKDVSIGNSNGKPFEVANVSLEDKLKLIDEIKKTE